MAKSINYLYPYPVLPMGQFVLSLDKATMPDELTSSASDSFIVDKEAQSFDVIIRSSFSKESLLPEQLGLAEPADAQTILSQVMQACAVCIVFESRSSRYRGLGKGNSHDGNGMTFYEVNELQDGIRTQLDSSDYRGALRVTAYLVFKEGHEYEYRRCGISNEVTFYFSDHETPPGGGIDNEWKKFTEDHDFEKYTKQYFKLQYPPPDGRKPKIWLNQSMEDFFNVMERKTSRGANAIVRKTMEHSIASRITHSLLSDALEELAAMEKVDINHKDSVEIDSTFDSVQLQILREFVSDLGLGDDFYAGLKELAHNIPSKEVTEKSSDFVQKKFEAAEPFEKLFKEFLEE